MIETGNVTMAFTLTLLAGLAMGGGSIISFIGKNTNKKFLSASLGFASGVMIYVAFVEIFMESRESLVEVYGGSKGLWVAVISFFLGMIFMVLTEKFCLKENQEENEEKSVYRMGVMTAIAIGIHNFPEGMAIFTSVLKTPALGFSVATAIAIHNISVGIAVSAPIYYATGSRKKAFIFSLISGLVEPLGALAGYVLFKSYLNEKVFGILLAAVAGIMVYIALDELLPSAQNDENHHIATYSMISGMIVMAVSLMVI
ncbi:zinc transporter ZupT [Fusobacterium ulcerans]|uniref:zinc transporter ZupT n=1 Tax=Fusobacterium ulcerans TaxID=861 RepID=UPI001032D359|nr:zinc transporter ZupT [Fusobacterium ulcerans]